MKMVDKILEEIKPTTVLSINNGNGINFLKFSPTAYSLLVYIHSNFCGRFVYISTGNKERRKIVKMVDNVAPSYSTRPKGRTGSGDADQFYHIYIFEYCSNKCRIIISIKEDPPFFQLTLSFNMACMPFQYYHL